MDVPIQARCAKSMKLFSLWAVLSAPLQLMAVDEPRAMVEVAGAMPLPVQFDEPPRPWITVTVAPAPATQVLQIRNTTVASDASALDVSNPSPPAPKGELK